jgi:hypothetical protein
MMNQLHKLRLGSVLKGLVAAVALLAGPYARARATFFQRGSAY